METRTKVIIGIGSVITIGLVAYFTRHLWLPNKSVVVIPPDVAVSPEQVLPPTYNVPVATPTPPTPSADSSGKKEEDRAMVGATTLLSGDLTAGKNKGLYAGLDGLRIMDMNNNLVFKTKKAQRVGTIYEAKKSGAIIMVYFIGPGGVKLKTASAGMNIK